jgi:hypothetical protein
MSKLLKLKKWLSLEGATKWLSITLEEEVNFKDLIQLIIDGELKVSWYFQERDGIEAVKVIKDNVYVLDSIRGKEFSETLTPLKYITDAQSSIPEDEFFRVYIDNDIHYHKAGIYRDYRNYSPAFDIEGVFNIHVDTGGMKNYFENVLFESVAEVESEYFEGIIVEDQEDNLFKIVSSYINKYDYNVPMWSHPPYPVKEYPKLSDLVILRSDLETFEQNLLQPEKSNNLRGSTESLTIALGLMSEILSKTNKKYTNGSKPNYSQLSQAIEQEAAKLGVGLTGSSNLQKALSASHKVIQGLIK